MFASRNNLSQSMLIEPCADFSLMDFRGLTLWFTCNPLHKQWKLKLYSCYNLMYHRKSHESYLKHSKCNYRLKMLYLSFRELKLPHVTSKNQGLKINVNWATIPSTLSSQLTYLFKIWGGPPSFQKPLVLTSTTPIQSTTISTISRIARGQQLKP